MEIIDWILRLTGLASFIYFVFSLFLHKKEYSTNIKITRVLNIDELPPTDSYIRFDDPNIYGEYVLFEPQDCIFRKVKYCSTKVSWNRVVQDKCIAQFRNITPSNGLIINTYFSCGIPSRMIKWYGDGGIKGTYLLSENGKDGNVDMRHYIYQFGMIQNLRKILNL